MVRLLHIAAGGPMGRLFVPPFVEALKKIGELTFVSGGEAMSDAERAALIRQCDILLTGWGSANVPVEIAADRGDLKYICNVTGSVRPFVPLEVVEAGVPLTNWGDAPAGRLAEGAVTLLLACLKGLPERIDLIRAGGWKTEPTFRSALMEGLDLGIYGCGVIGRRFIDMVRPFKPVMRVFDPYVDELPDDCIGVDSLADLFAQSQAVAIHAGLSDETRNSVNAELLAMLPDGGTVVNIARGGIVDQDALFAELESGRLRAGLDVLEPDWLAEDHPARQWPNLILTAHDIGCYRADKDSRLDTMHHIALDNIRRCLDGEPLRFAMDTVRYERST